MINLAIVMDPLSSLHVEKDSTLAIAENAKKRGWHVDYFELKDLSLKNGKAFGKNQLLSSFDVILMRKDPPFNQEYIYATYILEEAERSGALVINKPQSLRDANEKIFVSQFPECTPPTLVTRDIALLKLFLEEHQEIICKPLHSMGGYSIFKVTLSDLNTNVIFELLTQEGNAFMMAQRFIPEIEAGDKRILLINGNPFPHLLARIPTKGDFRGNLVKGAKGVAKPLSDRDRWICEKVRPILQAKGLYFVGLDVIGDYLTEINVTSPTGIRELDALCHSDIAGVFLDWVEKNI